MSSPICQMTAPMPVMSRPTISVGMVSALGCVDRLQVGHVPDDVEAQVLRVAASTHPAY